MGYKEIQLLEVKLKIWFFDIRNKCYNHMEKSKNQKLFELQQKIKLLKRKNSRLE